jgi:RNA polymerase sigma-70 factor (ECF subfamily)
MPGADLDDDELLARWRAGDARAGQILVRRHFDELYGFFRNKVDRGVDDLVQRTFLACVEGHQRIRSASFRTYMFAAARRILHRDFEQRCRERGIDPLESTVQDANGSVTQILAERREHRLLLLALQRIPLRDQVLLELYLYGLPQAEIAEITEQPAKTIRNTLFRARDKLRAAVQSLATDPALQRATLEDLDRLLDDAGVDRRRLLHHELVHGRAPPPEEATG